MGLLRSIMGMVRLELTSADITRFLTALNKANIPVFNVTRTGDLTVELDIYRRDHKIASFWAGRRCAKMRLIRRYGFYWMVRGLMRRKVLLAGIGLLLALVLFLPTRVFFIRVEGNHTIATRLILEKAETCGISFGVSRREVRSERIKNALLGAVPELQWAGVNTSGCVATISVKERTVPVGKTQQKGVCSIVAIRDGVIRECTVYRGNALCKVGQAVKAGEVLISGYTDCGVSIQATRADGEVFGETKRELNAFTPTIFVQRGKILRQEKKFSILIGKKRINFYKDSGILDPSCVKMYVESYLTLPGGFQLPIAVITEQWIYYNTEALQAEDCAQEILSHFTTTYLAELMTSGRILERWENFTQLDGVCCLEGEYACLEMLGRVQSEEIIRGNGKID